jgi:hypothetical protein
MYSGNNPTTINALRGQNAEILNVKAGGTFSNQWALKYFMLTELSFIQWRQLNEVNMQKIELGLQALSWFHMIPRRGSVFFPIRTHTLLWLIYFIINNQRGAALSSLIYCLLQDHSTYFWCSLHPSSGVHKTVVTTTGTSHVSEWYGWPNLAMT